MEQKKAFSLEEISRWINAEIFPPSHKELKITGFTTLESAKENELAFITSEKFLKQAKESLAAAIVAPYDLEIKTKTLVCVPNVWKAVVHLLDRFYPEPSLSNFIHPSAYIHPETQISKNVSIGACAVVEKGVVIEDQTRVGALSYLGENVRIGKNCLIHPSVTILRNCKIGDNVIVHSGVVIGSDGFKFEIIDGLPRKIRQVGRVVVESDVEIGANTCIDRASFTETRIARGAKLDNLIQVAHNVNIGSYCMIASQTGIAGSSKIGQACIIGGQAGIRDNIEIGDHVMVAGKTGVSKNTPSHSKVFGFVAMPVKKAFKRDAMINRLPQLVQTVKELEKRLAKLEKKIGN